MWTCQKCNARNSNEETSCYHLDESLEIFYGCVTKTLETIMSAQDAKFWDEWWRRRMAEGGTGDMFPMWPAPILRYRGAGYNQIPIFVAAPGRRAFCKSLTNLGQCCAIGCVIGVNIEGRVAETVKAVTDRGSVSRSPSPNGQNAQVLQVAHPTIPPLLSIMKPGVRFSQFRGHGVRGARGQIFGHSTFALISQRTPAETPSVASALRIERPGDATL
jgi:hypothetical protein